ncbi:MAG: Nif3-like dinuclear metal center hexameric protein [Myxococcales bacterium]|nr:Nif3-like dinuclear metal center hexameric protein [Myxococcales bacterium]
MGIQFSKLLSALESAAPIGLAATWDNVGLLIEAHGPEEQIQTVFMTIDLTEPVFEEAVAGGADVIITYHPILFGGVKRLVRTNPAHRVVIAALKNGISIYSPHTALDAIEGGVNDWLISGVGPVQNVSPLDPVLSDNANDGMGRRGHLETAAEIDLVASRLKAYLGLEHIRIARAQRHQSGKAITSVAVCPGAGGSLLAGLSDVDLVVTGEMRHHDVLALNSRGVSVILTEHTNCERGFLPSYTTRLKDLIGPASLSWHISQVDKDPLAVH